MSDDGHVLPHPFENIQLTAMEYRILKLFIHHESSQIAQQLKMHVRTVKFYLQIICCKFDCHNQRELLQLLTRHAVLVTLN